MKLTGPGKLIGDAARNVACYFDFDFDFAQGGCHVYLHAFIQLP